MTDSEIVENLNRWKTKSFTVFRVFNKEEAHEFERHGTVRLFTTKTKADAFAKEKYDVRPIVCDVAIGENDVKKTVFLQYSGSGPSFVYVEDAEKVYLDENKCKTDCEKLTDIERGGDTSYSYTKMVLE